MLWCQLIQTILGVLAIPRIPPVSQKYSKPEALWSELANAPEGTQERWYNKAVAYWDSQEASVNGVLGGYGHVSDDDITESRKFLLKVGAVETCALDC